MFNSVDTTCDRVDDALKVIIISNRLGFILDQALTKPSLDPAGPTSTDDNVREPDNETEHHWIVQRRDQDAAQVRGHLGAIVQEPAAEPARRCQLRAQRWISR